MFEAGTCNRSQWATVVDVAYDGDDDDDDIVADENGSQKTLHATTLRYDDDNVLRRKWSVCLCDLSKSNRAQHELESQIERTSQSTGDSAAEEVKVPQQCVPVNQQLTAEIKCAHPDCFCPSNHPYAVCLPCWDSSDLIFFSAWLLDHRSEFFRHAVGYIIILIQMLPSLRLLLLLLLLLSYVFDRRVVDSI